MFLGSKLNGWYYHLYKTFYKFSFEETEDFKVLYAPRQNCRRSSDTGTVIQYLNLCLPSGKLPISNKKVAGLMTFLKYIHEWSHDFYNKVISNENIIHKTNADEDCEN